ncbi:hypothetical protein DOY81_000443 [Sarcophaga bullata]|nr:hypothetical protein DOY81_000443 [Sarcophaga bullata]
MLFKQEVIVVGVLVVDCLKNVTSLLLLLSSMLLSMLLLLLSLSCTCCCCCCCPLGYLLLSTYDINIFPLLVISLEMIATAVFLLSLSLSLSLSLLLLLVFCRWWHTISVCCCKGSARCISFNLYSTDVCLTTAAKLLAFVNVFRFNDVADADADTETDAVSLVLVVVNNCVGDADIFVVFVALGVIISSMFLFLFLFLFTLVLYTSFIDAYFCCMHLGVLKDSLLFRVRMFLYNFRFNSLQYFILFIKLLNFHSKWQTESTFFFKSFYLLFMNIQGNVLYTLMSLIDRIVFFLYVFQAMQNPLNGLIKTMF